MANLPPHYCTMEGITILYIFSNEILCLVIWPLGANTVQQIQYTRAILTTHNYNSCSSFVLYFINMFINFIFHLFWGDGMGVKVIVSLKTHIYFLIVKNFIYLLIRENQWTINPFMIDEVSYPILHIRYDFLSYLYVLLCIPV